MSGIKQDPSSMVQYLPVEKNDVSIFEGEKYVQAFDPRFPDAWSVNEHQFSKTDNAQVQVRDDLKNQISLAPELPKNQTDYSKILFFLVSGFLIYKFLKKEF